MSDKKRGQSGFSILEVLTALVVAATLSTMLLGAQRQSMTMSQGAREAWNSLNLSQTILAERFPSKLKNPTSGWLPWPDVDNAKWKLSEDTGTSREYPIFILQTKLGQTEMTFDWVETRD